ncbi:unnamed protein product [Ostreobium quekettii]|uniref:Uncharacterized protein n=1 Tax=Ostreobium quekettii TaxID=121088 RepID=A0A8S1IR23_9CHLO|nr:unnamed protein product [Ostreobium quekettii]|eukprot:evm.model.scf_504EXC.3 EVM.evm.TU.scf_504EXC.3   scf_504EXC:24322-27751(+)
MALRRLASGLAGPLARLPGAPSALPCLSILAASAHDISVSRMGTWVDPWSTRAPDEEHPDEQTVFEHNQPKVWYGKQGDAKKGLADDTREHPFRGLMAGVCGIDDEIGTVWWAYDLTGGQIENNLQNAMLSDETKTEMYLRHVEDPDTWSVEKLAEEYRIRQQRVMAIIALKEMEHEMYYSDKEEEEQQQHVPEASRSTPSPTETEQHHAGEGTSEVAQATEASTTEQVGETDKARKKRWLEFCEWLERDVYNCTAKRGSGERHVLNMPTYPKFEAVKLEDAHKYDEWEISHVNHEMVDRQDKAMIKEFKERLLMNMGKIGTSLKKESRKPLFTSPPKKPMPILVTPIGRKYEDPYVAAPDGVKRKLTKDELLFWRRKNREAVQKRWKARRANSKEQSNDHEESNT